MRQPYKSVYVSLWAHVPRPVVSSESFLRLWWYGNGKRMLAREHLLFRTEAVTPCLIAASPPTPPSIPSAPTGDGHSVCTSCRGLRLNVSCYAPCNGEPHPLPPDRPLHSITSSLARCVLTLLRARGSRGSSGGASGKASSRNSIITSLSISS